MRYWLFENKEIVGPYDPDELSRLPSFSPKSLVCPEDRRGQDTRDWNWAEKFPELSSAVVKAFPAGPAVNRYGAAVSPTTINDLKTLGQVASKVEWLERSLSGLQEALRVKDTEVFGLKGELAEKTRVEDGLRNKCAELESRLSEVQGLRSDLAQTAAAERGAEETIAAQRRELETLSSELSRVREEMREMEERLTPKAPPAPPPLPMGQAPAMAPPPFSEHAPPPLPIAPPPPVEPPPLSAAAPKLPIPRVKLALGAAALAALAGVGILMKRHARKSPEPPPTAAPQEVPEVKAPEPAPPPPVAKPLAPKPVSIPKKKAKPPKKAPPAPKPPKAKKAQPPAAENAQWPVWEPPADKTKASPPPDKLILPGMEPGKTPPKAAAPPPPPPPPPPDETAKPANAPQAPKKKLSEDELLKSLLQQ